MPRAVPKRLWNIKQQLRKGNQSEVKHEALHKGSTRAADYPVALRNNAVCRDVAEAAKATLTDGGLSSFLPTIY